MSLATLNNVAVQYGNRIILDEVCLTIQPGDRLGMLGRNGTGKTTLLNLLAGRQQADAGTMDLAKGLRVGVLDQHPTFDEGPTVREAASTAFADRDDAHQELERIWEAMSTAEGEALDRLMHRQSVLQDRLESEGGWSVEHRIDATLHGVGMPEHLFDRPASQLSGGERSRLALATLLLSAPDLLLLDEPTNHLDIEGCAWLERFLRDTYAGAVVVVSHDRWLLDAVCTRIIELRRGTLESFPGNYSRYVTMRAERRLTEARAWEKQQDHIRREQSYIRRYKAGQRAKQARGRESRLQRFIESAEVERPEAEVVAAMRLPPPQRCGDRVMSVESLGITLGQRCLVEGLDLEVQRGDRIGVIGPNGAGKTTLLRCLLDALPPTGGQIEHGTGLSVGWFRQMQDHVDPELAVWEWVRRAIADAHGGEATEQLARDLAGAFLFSGEDQDRLLGTLSGGERARAVLAGLFGSGHNVLVLDEPTNHIDMATTERLERVLDRGGPWGGTLLMVSHDRALLESTCDRLIVLDGEGGAQVFQGRISAWLERQEKPPEPASPEQPRRMAPQKRQASPLDRLSLEALESGIERMEVRLGEIQQRMGDEEVWSDAEAMQSLSDEQAELAETLASYEAAWLQRSEAGEG
ncbi:MAG: ABC-F family ATP-binding cassette domain-containing protein [Phycisphaerales bacterium]|jgi:ATP-binding cassette subfamily F protein 3|nr:ABC-F family ATP-binding cassette domain-containing protein [Phycisphaerales bacterium]